MGIKQSDDYLAGLFVISRNIDGASGVSKPDVGGPPKNQMQGVRIC